LRKAFPLLAALAFCALACPDTLGQLCPAGTVSAGQFNVTLTLQAQSNSCVVTDDGDGGPADGSLGSSTPQMFAATLCSGLADGGTHVLLAVAQHGVRDSVLGPDAGFVFSSLSTNVQGTVCRCPLDVQETISGNLFGPPTGITPDSDGGLSNVVAIGGTVVDSVAASPPAGGADAGHCSCGLPCAVTYTLAGPKLQK